MFVMEELYELATVNTPDEWFSLLKFLAEKLGYSEILFGIKKSKKSDNRTAVIVSNFSCKWREKYEEANYSEVDPTVGHCFTSNLPIIWQESIYSETHQRHFFEEAQMHGFIQGVTLPLHGANGELGTLGLRAEKMKSADYVRHLKFTMPYLFMLRDYALEGGCSFLEKQEATEVVLTSREREILRWGATGKTSWEIATILSCTEANINFHFSNIRRKFDVTSRQSAIVKALQLKLIDV